MTKLNFPLQYLNTQDILTQLSFQSQIDQSLFRFTLKQSPIFNQWFIEIESLEQGFIIHPLTLFYPIYLNKQWILMAYTENRPPHYPPSMHLNELGKSWDIVILSQLELENYGF